MNQEEIMQQLQAAVALHNQGELDQAEVIYRSVLAVDANNFYALNFCGCICREKKSFDEAIDLLSKAIFLQPGNPDAAYNLGNVFKDAERWDEAIPCYEKTLGLRAEYPEALNNLGICLKEVERFEHSEIVLRRAVSIQPGFAGAWLNLGNTFKEQEKFEEAIASYRKAIEVNPDFADAYLNLGNVLNEEGEVEKAIASYRKAIEVKPDFADAYLNLGNTFKEQEKFEEAIASYRKAIELKPDFADAYLNLGNTFKEQEKFEEAIASYQNAIELKPDSADAFYLLAELEEGQSLVDDAISHYQRSLEIKQEFIVLGKRSDASNGKDLTSEVAQKIKTVLPSSYQLIPSFKDAIALESWASLWHVHIPKTGGMRMYNPLKLLLERIKLVGLSPARNLFHVSRCHSPLELQAYSRALNEVDGVLSGCMVNVFSVAQDLLWNDLCMRLQSQPARVAFYRPAEQRLVSALKYLYRSNQCDYSLLKKEINGGHLHLDNPTVRALSGVFDRELSQKDLSAALAKERVDYLLPLGDFSVGSRIQSAFLSANGLPNIILPSVVNSTSPKYSPSPEMMEDLLSLARARGFDQWDQALDDSIDLDDVLIELPDDSAALNDWTFIFYSETAQTSVDECVLMPTSELLSDKERWLPAKA
ncbi:tetratricopeptide repeat protein [Synechococcus sp. MU1651]|uniref:tetratricopeptide repeat protein n=1 Tax=Synechococcus sp. MU1651 TaxID=2508353 RepID=UPI002025B608